MLAFEHRHAVGRIHILVVGNAMTAVAGVRQRAATLRISIRSRQRGRGECDDEVGGKQNRTGNPRWHVQQSFLGLHGRAMVNESANSSESFTVSSRALREAPVMDPHGPR